MADSMMGRYQVNMAALDPRPDPPPRHSSFDREIVSLGRRMQRHTSNNGEKAGSRFPFKMLEKRSKSFSDLRTTGG